MEQGKQCYIRIVNSNHLHWVSRFTFSYKAILGFHDKYGDVIRLGPDTVAVADKDMIKQVLVTDDFPKAAIYEVFQSKFNYVSLEIR